MEKRDITTNVPANLNTAATETLQERNIESYLVLCLKNKERSLPLGLSETQSFIATHSIMKKDADGNVVLLSVKELQQSRDMRKPLNHNQYSILQAEAMMQEMQVYRAYLDFNPEDENAEPLPLVNSIQVAVILARLGIDLKTGRYLSDEVLEIIYGTTWDPEFVTDSTITVPDPVPSYSRRNMMAGVRKPKQTKMLLDKTIIGQDAAKEMLAAAVYQQELANRYNVLHKNDKNFVAMKPQRVLLYGAVGSGKTALLQTLAEVTGKPMVSYDVTTLVPPGFEGNSVADPVYDLLRKCGGDVEKASHGIICLDKWDQLFCGEAGERMSPPHKAALHSELLQLLDGREVGFKDEDGRHTLDTSNILFVIGGEFSELDDIVQARIRGEKYDKEAKPLIGFLRNISVKKEKDTAAMDDIPEATLADYKKCGVPVGITAVCRMKAPNRNDLMNILVHSDTSPVRQYEKMLKLHNITLQIPENALEAVAEKALEQKMGAHSLAGILEKALAPVVFRLADNRKRMTLYLRPDCIVAGKEPELLLGKTG